VIYKLKEFKVYF